MATPPRLVPLLEQFDWACERLSDRMTGPAGDSGTGVSIAVPAMTDAEYLWEPVPGCWSIRRRSAGPGPGAAILAGAGEWGRDSAPPPHPWPPPFTTIAWRPLRDPHRHGGEGASPSLRIDLAGHPCDCHPPDHQDDPATLTEAP